MIIHLLTMGWYQDYAYLEQWHLHIEPRQHTLSNRNDSDDQGPSDGIDYGSVDCHILLSSLLHNLIYKESSDPIGNNTTDDPSLEMNDFREKVKNYRLHYTQAVRTIPDFRL